jgi:regulator of sigma E protease
MIQGRVSTKALSGPIGIFDVGTRFISQGWAEFLRFLGILSINLAVVNLLPITPLDGGRLLLLLGEKARGRPLPPVLVGLTERVGITLVLLLMVFAIGQDLLRTFWSG